jgi:hypothetical protein
MLSATDGSDSGRRRVTRAALVVATVTVFVFLAGLLAVFTASPIAGASTRDLAVAPAVKLTVKISSPGKGAVTVKGKGVCEEQSCS